jgi:hypothetical protein
MSSTGNATHGNIITGGLITATGNITGGNLITAGIMSSTGNATHGNIITGGIVSATGNITASFFIGNGSQLTSLNTPNISNGNSNVNIATANGNVTISAVGNTTMTITGTGANISGTLSATSNITGGNLIANNLTSTRVPYVGTSKQLTDTAGLVWDNANQVLKPGAGGTEIGGDAGFGYLSTKNITASGNANIGNIGTGGLITATGNINGGNIITSGIVSATGNGTFGNVSATTFTGAFSGAATTAGTVTTAAQPNITSVGTLTSVSVSGNATVGNISATNHTGTTVSVTGNVTGGNLTTGGILSVTGVGVSSIAGNLNMNGNWLTNVGYAVANTDAASKLYVDTLVSTGISYHPPVYVATTTTLATATTGTTVYNSPNGAANGIGAFISTTGTFLNIDGFNVQSVGRRILVKDESNSAWNGIYTYSNTTAIVRATDADTYGPDATDHLSVNDYFFTQNGTVNEGTAFIVSAPTGVITFGTSNITFSTFSTSQVYDAGTGINITGTVISANASQTQITAVGTLTSLSVSGNANVGNIGGAAGVFSTIAGSLTTAAQPNITSVGTLTSLSVSGNITAGNISATNHTGTTSNITGQYITTLATGTAPFVVTSTTQVANLNVASAGLATYATTANSVAGANVSGAVAFATTANSVAGANVSGAVAFATTANSVAGANVSGTVSSASSATTAGSVTNSVTFNSGGSGDASGTTFNGGAARTISYNTVGAPSTGGTNASGTWGINITGSAGSATTAGTVTTAAQPNITSTGTLTRVIVGDGSAGSPSIAFASDGAIDTGFYWGGDGYINWTNNGVRRGQFRPDGTAEIGTVLTTSITTGANTTAGTITGNWSLSTGSKLNATYADLAEKYVADAEYKPGTVLVFGGEQEVTLSTESDSFRVAGVVTTNPAYTMNNECEGEHIATIALQGRVPVKVIGPVFKGDLLVSCGNGHAIANNIARAGTIIGKSLENFSEASGVIEVAVGRF